MVGGSLVGETVGCCSVGDGDGNLCDDSTGAELVLAAGDIMYVVGCGEEYLVVLVETGMEGVLTFALDFRNLEIAAVFVGVEADGDVTTKTEMRYQRDNQYMLRDRLFGTLDKNNSEHKDCQIVSAIIYSYCARKYVPSSLGNSWPCRWV